MSYLTDEWAEDWPDMYADEDWPFRDRVVESMEVTDVATYVDLIVAHHPHADDEFSYRDAQAVLWYDE